MAGSLRFSGKDPLAFLRYARGRGDVVFIEWDRSPVWLLNHPDAIHAALLDRQGNFARSGGPPRLSRLLGEGLLRSQGEIHRRQRRLTQPAFVPRQLEAYAQSIVRETERCVRRWGDGQAIDFHREMVDLTLAIVGSAFFSLSWSEEVRAIGRAVGKAILSLPPARLAWQEKWRQWNFDRAVSFLDGVIDRMIRERRLVTRAPQDLLSVLIGSREEEGFGEPMTDRALRDELVTLLIAGHETTASALAWAGYLLALHPSVQERLRQEVKPEGSKAVAELPYTRGVFAEALRLYPPAWILFRKVLATQKLGEMLIPAGHHVAVSPYTLGRDGRFFDEPESFCPERWITAAESRAFIPFGLGRRRCLGESFAWDEATRVVITGAALAFRILRFQPIATQATPKDKRVMGGRWPGQRLGCHHP